MLTLNKIKKSFDTRRVLSGVSFSLGQGQRVALVGQNGAGKSTLLKIIARIEEEDGGQVQFSKSALVGYLPQETTLVSGETVGEFLRRASGVTELERSLSRLESKLSDPKALARYEQQEEEYRRLGGYQFRDRAQFFLDGLALGDISFDRPVNELSGGEKRKLSLTGVLLRGVDLLLLDEPTNNLDLPALLWLESYLVLSGATLLIASHDRRFLDHVVEKVVELDIETRTATMHGGNWSAYALAKARARRRQKELYRAQEDEKSRLLSSAGEKRVWIIKAKEKKIKDNDKMLRGYRINRAAQKHGARAKALETKVRQIDRIEKPRERSPLSFELAVENLAKGYLAQLIRTRIGYGRSFRSEPLSLGIRWGERIAFLGENGAGKSTLLKTIAGELEPLTGKVERKKGIVFGNVMQEHENIPRTLTPLSYFAQFLGIREREAVLSALARFQFTPEFVDTRIDRLSPGERVRFILATLVSRGSHILVLDEPTNHLDLEAIEALEEALERYVGTILIVTHDRTFLDHLDVSSTYLLSSGQLTLVDSFARYEQSLLPKIKRQQKRLETRLGKRG